MNIRFFNIVWDTDGEPVELPVEVTMVVEADLDVNENGADVLSDTYGFCVESFEWETV